MTTIKTAIFDESGILIPARIELFETSGPVSPAYQYRTKIALYTDNGEIWYDCDDDRKFLNGKPLQSIHIHNQLKPAKLQKIIQQIHKIEGIQGGKDVDFIGSARNKVGISFNYISVCIGNVINLKVDYLLSSYDTESFKLYQKLIELLKSLAH